MSPRLFKVEPLFLRLLVTYKRPATVNLRFLMSRAWEGDASSHECTASCSGIKQRAAAYLQWMQFGVWGVAARNRLLQLRWRLSVSPSQISVETTPRGT
jgi:hypothetical protein